MVGEESSPASRLLLRKLEFLRFSSPRCLGLKKFGMKYCLMTTRKKKSSGKRIPATGIHVIPKTSIRTDVGILWMSGVTPIQPATNRDCNRLLILCSFTRTGKGPVNTNLPLEDSKASCVHGRLGLV
ncbi:hypothetical protein U9M48_042350 [Paspalum notatum var. saurae]|uniref:Uncharacterized protein n=1 Tax=Paspalum notatum var. saurae TaxID=547442 RepID=A0AAQ3UQM7_PASNO